MSKAIVFGASSGIGKELAALLVKDGYQVAITGRRFELLQTIKESAPEQYHIFQHDVQQLDQTEKVFQKIMYVFGTVDLVVLSSGIGDVNRKLLWETEMNTFQTNIIGAAKVYNLAFNQFVKQGFGHLVGITSIASLRGNRFAPAYFSSKAFQANYLESLYLKSKEVKSGKVYVTDIRPGYVDTRMALGDEIFWMVPLDKATRQIYGAVKRKKRKVYISKRWNLIAWVLRVVPSWLIKKFM